MPEHMIVKPEKIAAAAAVILEKKLVVPAIFQREGIDQFKGANDDTINVVVEGVVPWRVYGWRNDRSEPIQFDQYAERKIAVSFGGDMYSALKLTDEQHDFDLFGWGKLMRKQTEAIAKGLEAKALETLMDAPYAVTLGADSSVGMRSHLIRARRTLNALHAPTSGRTLLVGTDWEQALLEDEKLNLAQNVGEAEAVSALREATIGRRYGFNVVVAQELPADTAFALTESAFIFLTGAPSVPQSVPFGATAAHEGVALRWIRDYDSTYLQDRSVVNTYWGYRHVPDPLLGMTSTGQAYVSKHQHFVRAIKLVLDGEDSLPDPVAGRPDEGFSAEVDEELANITGIKVDAAPPVGD